ncbi:hypothetical protein [Alkalicoccobacillus murimartini]|uniref:Indole-3-glycerol phosphate synthase n=1 Tax=Alkalicoccobacillus murimartini TaxID=171685 RepID=A0ABT9YCZ1_9BACI|nr:hypothetical protein [Alkalicoccobacillus murimartini]MDQ0205586.1 indole-3-glycerol phosphate synthase [Alkalicoccobacillus murimartini]
MMMEWTLASLLGIAVLLIILSFFRKERNSKYEQQIENMSISFMQEIYQLKNQIRTLELDAEIIAQHTPLATRSETQLQIMRDVLDLHKRGYSSEGIASETGLTSMEVDRVLSPFLDRPEEGKKVMTHG